LSKQLSLEYTPQISRLTLIPLHLSPDPDEHLASITEGRLNTFAAEYVPDYLRTKNDPSMESKIHLYEAKAATLTAEASTKQVAQFQKIVGHVHDIVQKAHDEWEIDSMNRVMQMQTFNPADTQILVKAVGMGVGLKQMPGVAGGGIIGPGGPRMPGPGVPMSSVSPNIPQIGKLPSSIKTNIKSASLGHPYR
jgi:mediator of RNA polymerase II transcription subunit 8